MSAQEFEDVTRELPAHLGLLLAQADSLAQVDVQKASRGQKRALREVAHAERCLEEAREQLARETAYATLAQQGARNVVTRAQTAALAALGIDRKPEEVEIVSRDDGMPVAVKWKQPKLTEKDRADKAAAEKRLADEVAKALGEKAEAKKNGAALAAAK